MTLTLRARTIQGWTIESPLETFKFPGGESHIKGTEKMLNAFRYQLADLRGAGAEDLIALSMWADACYRRSEKTVLFLPYLPGARADRGIPVGAEVYADLLNGLFIDQIITLDPHSEMMPSLISNSELPGSAGNNLTVFPFERIIRKEIQDATSDIRPQMYTGVIAPDKGAVDRATRAAEAMGVPVLRAEKSRDFETGKLTGFHMIDELPVDGKFLLVDDICDGGGTFIGLAEATGLLAPQLDLWVTHGIFSKGLRTLWSYFGHIYTTDSHPGAQAAAYGDPEVSEDLLTVFPLVPYLTEAIDL